MHFLVFFDRENIGLCFLDSTHEFINSFSTYFSTRVEVHKPSSGHDRQRFGASDIHALLCVALNYAECHEYVLPSDSVSQVSKQFELLDSMSKTSSCFELFRLFYKLFSTSELMHSTYIVRYI